MTSFLSSIIVLLVILHNISLSTAASCPCKNTSLCNNIKTNYTKELYGFLGGGKSKLNDTSFYNWTYTTAFAINYKDTNESGMNDTMCTAHSHGVRMILWNYPSMPLTADVNTQMAWIEKAFNLVKFLNYDGITFDYEGSMLWNDPKMPYYVSLVNRTTQYFHENLPGSTTSVCVAFQAYLQWGRQYDYIGLANAADYLYIMGYDVCYMLHNPLHHRPSAPRSDFPDFHWFYIDKWSNMGWSMYCKSCFTNYEYSKRCSIIP